MGISLTIAIAEPSAIVRYGLETVLKRLSGFRLQLVEIVSMEQLVEMLRKHKPDMLIINPSVPGCTSLQRIKEDSGCMEMKCLALLYTVADPSLLRFYDGQISIYDGVDDLQGKLQRFQGLSVEEAENDEQQTLSLREKEIVVCVVKGMTNREIADRLFLSTHTVVTHRRNIARKLQVHSVSGLTVYAIANKLVELNDIKL